MKKMIRYFLVIILSAFVVNTCGCGRNVAAKDGKYTIITTVFPIYDWTRNIIGENDNIELKLLLDNGVDMHSYQPTVEDIVAIRNCDLFIYVGGESDFWIENVLSENDSQGQVLNLMEVLGDMALEEEIIEGMSIREEEEDSETDEHIWLSLRNAEVCVNAICETVCEVFPEDKKLYDNYEDYIEKIRETDAYYTELMKKTDIDRVVVADRFPFAYMTRDYGVQYFAAFPGCYADASASFDTIFFLADRVEEYGIDTILCTESSDMTIPNAVEKIADGAQAIRTLDSMQSVSMDDINNGINYLDIMKEDLQVLYEACTRG